MTSRRWNVVIACGVSLVILAALYVEGAPGWKYWFAVFPFGVLWIEQMIRGIASEEGERRCAILEVWRVYQPRLDQLEAAADAGCYEDSKGIFAPAISTYKQVAALEDRQRALKDERRAVIAEVKAGEIQAIDVLEWRSDDRFAALAKDLDTPIPDLTRWGVVEETEGAS